MLKLNEMFDRWKSQRASGDVPEKPETPLRAMPVLLAGADTPPVIIDALRAATATEALLLARTFVDTPAHEASTLMLLGQRGVGKTVAACWALGKVMQRLEAVQRPSGSEVRRGTSGHFVRAGTFDRSLTDAEWFERMLRTGCLVLDDLGKEPNSELFRTRLFELLDTRQGERRRTIVTSNLSKRDFAARYGATLADRMRDGCLSVELEGESMRGAAP